MHVGVFESIWNDSYGETVVGDVEYGEADAIDSNRAFLNN